MKKIFVFVYFLVFSQLVTAQGLENIIVEEYCTSAYGTTYRIYVDMAPGYNMQAIFGIENHPLIFETTTTFFNSIDGGSTVGARINPNKLNEGTVAYDSWLTVGSATKSHLGVVKDKDTDGSIIKMNKFKNADGLVSGEILDVVLYQSTLDEFDDGAKVSSFNNDDIIVAVLGRLNAPDEDNKVLIAQLTTDGELSFELNVQMGNPDCGEFEQYVAKEATGKQIQFSGLIYGKN